MNAALADAVPVFAAGAQAAAEMRASPPTGLVLSGGGARAAYQVGVLQALTELLPDAVLRRNPFPIIVGTSAGAINATALAAGAEDFRATVAHIVAAWQNVRADQVYRTDPWGVARTGARWLTAMTINWLLHHEARAQPKSLFDNAPLAGFLAHLIDTGRIDRALAAGHLSALAVSASSYTSGQHVTWYQSNHPIEPWTRSQRIAIQESIGIPHLLASSAIPFVFPAQALPCNGRREYFGDGSMRQLAPISPAIHLGAHRVLVVGVGRLHEPPPEAPLADANYPSLAQIAGHALSSIFLDALAVDLERLQRINRTLALMPPQARVGYPLRSIDVLLISPSQRLDDLAAQHVGSLPPMVRALMRGVGATEARGSALVSYLLFEPGYTRALIALGRADTFARRAEVCQFFEEAACVS